MTAHQIPGRDQPKPFRAANVVITGAGLITSAGATPEACFGAVRDHTCNFDAMSAMESPLPPGSSGSQAIDIESPDDRPREARYLRRAILDALQSARLSSQGDGRRRMLVLGTTLHGIRAGGRFLRNDDPSELSLFLANAISACAAEGIDFAAGTMTNCSACSSGLGAISLATTLLRAGHADVVVAGGYDPISEYAWAGFSSLRLVARGALRPFARGREGMKLGEGYGVIVLEREADAIARGVEARASVAGWGESADAHHLTQPLPTGDGAASAIRQALRRAGLSPDRLGLVVAHATGTPDNDASEAQAIASVMGEAGGAAPVVGLKSHLGHTLGAAGAVELILASEAMRHDTILTCRHVEPADVEYEELGIAVGPSRPARIDATLSSSLGFGGANSSVVLTSQRPSPSTSLPTLGSPPAVWITGIAALTADGGLPVQPAPTRSRATIDVAQLGELFKGRRTRRLSPYVKYTVASLLRAIADAGLERQSVEQATALLGSMHGSPSYCYDYYDQIVREGVLAANPVLFAEGVPNAAAAHVSVLLGVRGACQAIIGSRTCGLDALALGAARIQEGASDVVLVGAAEETHPVIDRAYASALGSPLRSFAGACAVVLESSTHAAARGAHPICIVDSTHWAWNPRSRMVRAMADIIRATASELVIGTGVGTFLERIERVAARRTRSHIDIEDASRIGEHFATTPLLVLMEALRSGTIPVGGHAALVCGDWLGSCIGVRIARGPREVRYKEIAT